MICLVSQSQFCVVAMILYTCIWVPIREAKDAVVSLVWFVVLFAYHRPIVETSSGSPEPFLPVTRLVELRNVNEVDIDETCSICLMEFEGQDLVTQLSKCCHVFHINCIDKWLDCNNFTCPLCRSSFLQNANANSLPKHHYHFHLNPYIPSYIGYSWH